MLAVLTVQANAEASQTMLEHIFVKLRAHERTCPGHGLLMYQLYKNQAQLGIR